MESETVRLISTGPVLASGGHWSPLYLFAPGIENIELYSLFRFDLESSLFPLGKRDVNVQEIYPVQFTHTMGTVVFHDDHVYCAVYRRAVERHLPEVGTSVRFQSWGAWHRLTAVPESKISSFIHDFWAERYPLQAIARAAYGRRD